MIGKLYVEPSSLCNLRCKMCFRNNWFGETLAIMPEDTCNAVTESLEHGVASTVFFGGMGEPLLHPGIFRMIRAAKKGGASVELITNATLLNKEMADRLLAAGLDMLWVSMDGFTKESYEKVRLGSMYGKIVSNLSYFSQVKGNTKLGITFVMMKENLPELAHINAFADRYRVDQLNLSHVVPGALLKPEDAIYDLDYPVGKMYRWEKKRTPQEAEVCPFLAEKACFIRQDGEVLPCMQLLHNSDTFLFEEKRRVYAHSFGNINRERLEAIYESPEYRAFRQRVEEFDFPFCTSCEGCSLRLENQTDCMHNPAPTCGACLWAQGWIRCP